MIKSDFLFYYPNGAYMSHKYDVVGLGNALMDALYILPNDSLLSVEEKLCI